MNEQVLDTPEEMVSSESEDFAAERTEQVERFVKTSPGYYREQFAKIGSESRFVWTLPIHLVTIYSQSTWPVLGPRSKTRLLWP